MEDQFATNFQEEEEFHLRELLEVLRKQIETIFIQWQSMFIFAHSAVSIKCPITKFLFLIIDFSTATFEFQFHI